MSCVGISAVPRFTVVAATAISVRTAATATDLATRWLDDWRAALERRVDEQARGEAALREWHMAAAEAVGLNAVIRVVAARAARSGVPVDLPERLSLDAKSLAEVGRWLAMALPRVERARAKLADAAQVGAALPGGTQVGAASPGGTARSSPADAQPSVAEALARYQVRLRDRHAEPTVRADPPGTPGPDRTARVERVVLGLDPDATDEGRELVLGTAASTLAADPSDVSMYLSTLRQRVKEVNAVAVDRRLAAQWLEALEHTGADSCAELRAVVDGTAPLTPGLAGRARAALEHARAVTQARYRSEVVRELLAAQGYLGTEESADGRPARLRIEGAGWRGQHTAEVWIDDDLAVRARLVREDGAQGDDARLVDRDRADDLAAVLAEVAHEMGHRGIVGVASHVHPTQHRHDVGAPPGAKSAAPRPATRSRPAGGPSDNATRR